MLMPKDRKVLAHQEQMEELLVNQLQLDVVSVR